MILEQWILVIVVGGLCGFLGQCLRIVVGLHKASEDVPKKPFDVVRMIVSIVIGVAAGALTSIVTVNTPTASTDQVMALIAAGYAGADFIEGFIGKYLPKVD